MNALRRRIAPMTWIALVAIWALAVLPTLSHALAHASGGKQAWTEVCTPQGMRLVAVPTDDLAEPGPLQASGHLEHCALCTLAQDTSALPAPAAPRLPDLPGAAAVPLLFLRAPHTLHAWRNAQPRGPPVLG